MHKVDSYGSTAQQEFTNGDPGNGIPRTVLAAKFMNTVQRELVNLVLQSGQALSDTDDAQVLKAALLHVATLTALRALPIPSVQAANIMVWCRDIGGGVSQPYRWSATSTVADDGDLTIRPASNPTQGRWLAIPPARASYAVTATTATNAATQAVGTNNTSIASTAYVQQNMLGGAAQSWQSVSRAFNTTYTNTTGRPLQVFITVTIDVGSGGSTTSFQVNGTTIGTVQGDISHQGPCINAIVPAGATYRLIPGVNAGISSWSELR